MLEKIDRIFSRFNQLCGRILVLVLILMTINVFYDVVMRYVFHNSSVGMQEMEWHLFSLLILFGIGYTLLEDGHVRVDFIYQGYSAKTKTIINIFGTLFLLLPLALLIISGSVEFVYNAWEIGEISDDPGGLPYRWLIKAMIPLAFLFLLVNAIGYIIRNIRFFCLINAKKEKR